MEETLEEMGAQAVGALWKGQCSRQRERAGCRGPAAGGSPAREGLWEDELSEAAEASAGEGDRLFLQGEGAARRGGARLDVGLNGPLDAGARGRRGRSPCWARGRRDSREGVTTCVRVVSGALDQGQRLAH